MNHTFSIHTTQDLHVREYLDINKMATLCIKTVNFQLQQNILMA